MKILFVGRKFDGVAGGLERSVITLMNQMDARGHQPGLLTWDAEGAKTHYPLTTRASWWKLDLGNPARKASWALRWARQKRLRAIVKEFQPDVIVGFQHGAFLAVRLATLGMGIPVIAAERNAPQRFDYLRAGRYKSLIFLSFLLAKAITVQFAEYRGHYPGWLRSRIVHVPNPVQPAAGFADPSGRKKGQKTLLFVGHLSYQKNPWVLLNAFSELVGQYPDWRLVLVSAGPYRQDIEQWIDAQGLQDRILLQGIVEDIAPWFQHSHLFCLPSLWEGFPNALAEALAHGLPAVGFAECAGVNRLIRHQYNGLLAEGNNNVESLAASLKLMMASPTRRAEMGTLAIDSVADFEPQKVFAQWEALFARLAKGYVTVNRS